MFYEFRSKTNKLGDLEPKQVSFFVEDTPLFTTMDAGYFLGIAGYLKSGKTMQDYQAFVLFL